MTQLAPMHDSSVKAKEAALQAFNLARRVHLVAQYAQPMARLEAAVSEAEMAAAFLTSLAETLKAEIGRIQIETAEEDDLAAPPVEPPAVLALARAPRSAAKAVRRPAKRPAQRAEARRA